MNERELKKIEQIRNGNFERYNQLKKDQYNDGLIPNEDPSYYGFSEEEMEFIKCLEKSTKRKKADFRKHTFFISEFYDNIGFLTLTYSNKTRNSSNLDSKKKYTTKALKLCFDDFIGKFEISPSGKIHFHAIVGWNGKTDTFTRLIDGHPQTLVKKHDLTKEWYGETDQNGQPTKFGNYDLILINKTKTDHKKAANYTLKSLNTLESYVTKNEQIDFSDIIDEELVIAVNHSNILTARNTPYQKWKKDQTEQDRFIKRMCRVFEPSFYSKNKYNSKNIFREWAIENINTNISPRKSEKMFMFEENFKLVSTEDYKEKIND